MGDDRADRISSSSLSKDAIDPFGKLILLFSLDGDGDLEVCPRSFRFGKLLRFCRFDGGVLTPSRLLGGSGGNAIVSPISLLC